MAAGRGRSARRAPSPRIPPSAAVVDASTPGGAQDWFAMPRVVSSDVLPLTSALLA